MISMIVGTGKSQNNGFLWLRRIPTPIKINLALPPPHSPPKEFLHAKRGVVWAWRTFLQKEPKSPGPQKVSAAISGPGIAGGKITKALVAVVTRKSAVPKSSRSKRGRTQKHANEHKRVQMSAKEHKLR